MDRGAKDYEDQGRGQTPGRQEAARARRRQGSRTRAAPFGCAGTEGRDERSADGDQPGVARPAAGVRHGGGARRQAVRGQQGVRLPAGRRRPPPGRGPWCIAELRKISRGANPIAPGRHSGAARAALERQIVHIADVQADPEYTSAASRVDPIRTVLAVPILKLAQLLGVIVIYRLEVDPFTDVQIALVQAFADQAAIAHRECAAVQRGERPQQRPDRSAGATERDERDPARDRQLADRPPAGTRTVVTGGGAILRRARRHAPENRRRRASLRAAVARSPTWWHARRTDRARSRFR